MRDKVRQSTTFCYMQQRQVSYVAKKQKTDVRCLLGLEHCVEIFPLIERKTVNSNVLCTMYNSNAKY